MYGRGNARLLALLYVSLRGSGLKEASVGKVFDVCFSFAVFIGSGIRIYLRVACAPAPAYETVKAGQRLLCEGRHASLSSSFSEIEFGRARPTSLLHSTMHLLIPSGEERGRGRTRYRSGRKEREGMKEGHKVQRRGREKRGKWPEKEGSKEEEGEKREMMAGRG